MLPRVNLARCENADYLVFGTDDFISRTLTQTGVWDPNLQLLTKLFTMEMEKPLVLDIGANLGGFCVPTGKMLRQSGGSVCAFEPQRIVFYQLCGNVFLNQLDNVQVFNLAVGEQNGLIQIPVPDYSSLKNIGGYCLDQQNRVRTGIENAMSDKTELVTMVALDSFNFEKAPAFIKLDVEGFELSVLKGATKFLKDNGYPPVYFEAWNAPWFAQDRAALMAFIEGMGYEISRFAPADYVAQHPQNPVHVNVDLSADWSTLNIERIR